MSKYKTSNFFCQYNFKRNLCPIDYLLIQNFLILHSYKCNRLHPYLKLVNMNFAQSILY